MIFILASATERIKRTGQRILRTVEEKEDDKLLCGIKRHLDLTASL